MKNINRVNNKKKYILALAGLIALAGVYLAVARYMHLAPFANMNRTYQPGEQIVNMNRTDSEKQQTEALEKDPQKKLQNTQTDTPAAPATDSASGKQIANVLITNAGIFNGKVSASGFVSNVVESDGSCEYVFASDTQVIKKTSTTLPNATSTTCKTVSFPDTELATTGTWKVTLNYNSATSAGTSPVKEFQK